jgi:ketosteroid isomerase-like protein
VTTQEVASELVRLCSQGQYEEATKKLYSPNIVSVEPGAPPGQSRETTGLDGVLQKGKWWIENHEVHSQQVEGPLVAGSHFSVAFKMDVTHKPNNQRFQMQEIAVYRVADGKIIREEFFYAM